jgi:hypothetical protein
VKQAAALKDASANGIAAVDDLGAIAEPVAQRGREHGVELDRRDVAGAASEHLGRRPEAGPDLEHLAVELKAVDRRRHELLAHMALPCLALAVPVMRAVHGHRRECHT